MKCFYHKEVEAIGICKKCFRGICSECVSETQTGIFCTKTCKKKEEDTIEDMKKQNFGIFIVGIIIFLVGLLFWFHLKSPPVGIVFLISGIFLCFYAWKRKKMIRNL